MLIHSLESFNYMLYRREVRLPSHDTSNNQIHDLVVSAFDDTSSGEPSIDVTGWRLLFSGAMGQGKSGGLRVYGVESRHLKPSHVATYVLLLTYNFLARSLILLNRCCTHYRQKYKKAFFIVLPKGSKDLPFDRHSQYIPRLYHGGENSSEVSEGGEESQDDCKKTEVLSDGYSAGHNEVSLSKACKILNPLYFVRVLISQRYPPSGTERRWIVIQTSMLQISETVTRQNTLKNLVSLWPCCTLFCID